MVPDYLKQATFSRTILVCSIFLCAGCFWQSKDEEAPIPSAEPTHEAARPTVRKNIDSEKSFLTFTSQKNADSTYQGKFPRITGYVEYPGQDGTLDGATLHMVLDVSSLQTQQASLTQELLGSNHLNASRYPTIQFTSRFIEKADKDLYIADGITVLRGEPQESHLELRMRNGDIWINALWEENEFGVEERNVPATPIEGRLSLLN